MIALLTAALVSAAAGTPEARQERFLELLRTYPQRPMTESHRLAAGLIDEGPFPERDRAIFWIGSAKLAGKDLDGARSSFARLRREHPGSPWIERALLGEAEASAQQRDYGAALRWLALGAGARDPAVRELARLSSAQVRLLLARQRWAFAALAFAAAVLAFLFASIARRRPVRWWPLPVELQVVIPVLAVLALLSLRQDPAPRAAVLQLCGAGLVLVSANGYRLRAASPGAIGRMLQIALTALALAACFYAAIWRAELISMVLETFRAGPE